MKTKEENNAINNIFDLKSLLFTILGSWYYFVLSILFAGIAGFAYLRYTPELYTSSTRIEVIRNQPSSTAEGVVSPYIDDSPSFMKHEKILFGSYPLIFRTIKDLKFDIKYSTVGNVKTSETLITPIIISGISDSARIEMTQDLKGLKFEVFLIDKTHFEIKGKKIKNAKYKFGKKINIKDHEFTVELSRHHINPTRIGEFNFSIYSDQKSKESHPKNIKYKDISPVLVEFLGLKRVAKKYQKKLSISIPENDANILEISIDHQDQHKSVSFLNRLTYNHIKSDSLRRLDISFSLADFTQKILDQLDSKQDSISDQIEKFQRNNEIPDLDAKTKDLYQNIRRLEEDLAKCFNKRNYYTYLKDAIQTGVELDKLRSPPFIDNEQVNPMLHKIIVAIRDYQLKRDELYDGGQINNPSISEFDRRIKKLSLEILEDISINQQKNNVKIHDLKREISEEESALGAVPMESRRLEEMRREQKRIKTNYDIYALENANARFASTSVRPQYEVKEPAEYFSGKPPSSPNPTKVYIIAIFLGILVPILIILFLDAINNKIYSKSDLDRLSPINVLSVIGRNFSGNPLISNLNPKSSVAEAFRALRSSLEFENKSGKNKVYLFTSSVSGEGKTFLAENLAIVYANSGKKTLLIGGDLRRPKLFKDFELYNMDGLSSFLEKKSVLKDVINESEFENLHIIPCGDLPHNPADLFVGEKFRELMLYARKNYDRIIIDTPPLGLVADAFIIMKYTDINLYVVRQNFTDKRLLRYINDLYSEKRVENLFLVLNDVYSGAGVYGYSAYNYGSYGGYTGYSYGYNTYITDSDYFDEDEKK